jgi:hypothetical protein
MIDPHVHICNHLQVMGPLVGREKFSELHQCTQQVAGSTDSTSHWSENDMHFKENCRLPGSTQFPPMPTTAETEDFRDLPSNPYTSCQLATVSDQTTLQLDRSIFPQMVPPRGKGMSFDNLHFHIRPISKSSAPISVVW